MHRRNLQEILLLGGIPCKLSQHHPLHPGDSSGTRDGTLDPREPQELAVLPGLFWSWGMIIVVWEWDIQHAEPQGDTEVSLLSVSSAVPREGCSPFCANNLLPLKATDYFQITVSPSMSLRHQFRCLEGQMLIQATMAHQAPVIDTSFHRQWWPVTPQTPLAG